MMEERVIVLEKKIREIEARLVGHVPPLEAPAAPAEEVVEESDDAPTQKD